MSNVPMTFEQSVRAKIDETIGQMFPENLMNIMIHEQRVKMERETLPELIKQAITEKFKQQIKAELDKPEYNNIYDAQGVQGASTMVKKIITENADVLLAGLVGGMVQQTIYTLRQQMNSGRMF